MVRSLSRRFRRNLVVLFGVSLGALTAAPAAARCPNEAPADPACVPVASLAMPTVHAEALLPRGKTANAYAGGGFDFSLLSWSNNVESFGPSQGALRLGASYLRAEGDRALVTYRFSTLVSFEGNASRRFLIPTFGTAIGGLWETHEKSKAAAEGSLGLFLVYTRRIVIDLQAGILLPLSSSQSLLGPKAQLSVGVALW